MSGYLYDHSPMSLKKTPWYLLLLPVFFVLHAFIYYYDFVPLHEALLLILAYCSASVLIAGLSWLYYKNIRKAAFVSFVIMAFQLFYGYGVSIVFMFISDDYYPGYGFIIPISLLVLVATIIIVKRIKQPFYRITLFLNLLLFLFIIIEASRFITTANRPAPTTIAGMGQCDTCRKPDVYFIILDGYTNNIALKEKFGFDNIAFINELSKRGFYVAGNSTSNYNSTPYSMASTLNMDYLDVSPSIKQAELYYCYRRIRDNTVLNFFHSTNYTFYNYSFFDVEKQPALGPEYFLPRNSSLVTSQTFLSRIIKHLTHDWRLLYRTDIRDNVESFINMTKNISGKATTHPKFVYTHLLMPHAPYFYDSLGNSTGLDTVSCDTNISDEKLYAYYTSYLLYCNKRVLELTDHIISHSSTPPLIILAGDHGYRDMDDKRKDYEYMNLQAILLPSRNYKDFYEQLSSVNLFRVVLNTEFNQKLPLLKDRLIYLKE